jgi:hypothetical protein
VSTEEQKPTPNRRDRARQVLDLRAQGVTWGEIGRRFGVSYRTAQRWVEGCGDAAAKKRHQSSGKFKQAATLGEHDGEIVYRSPADAPKTLDQLLDAFQIDRAEWAIGDRVVPNFWGNEANPNWQIKATLHRIPEWFGAAALDVRQVKRQPVSSDPGRPIAVLPDTQFGFRWDYDARTLEPLHDPAALALAIEVTRRAQPRAWVQLGDLMDLAPWSTKYTADPTLRQTTQPTLQATHDWLADLCEVVPDAQGYVIKGNHDERIDKALLEKIPEALRLRRVGDSGRAFGVAHLLRLDELGIEYIEGYPGPGLWIDGILFEHGTAVAQGGGATVARVLKGANQSTLQGHIHRVEAAGRTIWTADGSRVIWCISPGTLSRIDGAVPGSNRPDWQQGMALLWVDAGRVFFELIPFIDGVAFFRGEKISA